MDCASGKGCFPQPKFLMYNIIGWGAITGEEAMMQHLLNGPITASFCASDELIAYRGGYILNNYWLLIFSIL